MKLRYLFLSAALLSTTMATAMGNYADSLAILKQRLDSIQQVNIGQNRQPAANARFYRLFGPTTFYHTAANKLLRLDGNLSGKDAVVDEIDRALMRVYMNRPDLVVNSQNRLSEAGSIRRGADEPIRNSVDLVERIAPEPLAEDTVPLEIEVQKPKFWTHKGDYFLQFLQNYISGNWYKGGESNYSMLGSITMEANYNNKQKVKWDNKLEMKLGFMTSKGDSLHEFKSTDDLLRLTSKLGLQATKRWYYTLQVVAQTQFVRGYKSNDLFVYSDFLSPFKLNVSLGMDYAVEALNKKLTGSIHLSPLAYNMIYVDRGALATRNSLKEGKHVLHELGSLFTIDLEWKISENINWKTRMYGFSSYKRVEWEWENTFTFKFNKYISSNLFIYPRFDDGAKRDGDHGYWQLKEYLSLGFNYTF
ncbi:MAG: DUF3078 domain-containing protein [Prevotella sp.]|nr:DUF3078 domain-containing protein [Prevotella sp.]